MLSPAPLLSLCALTVLAVAVVLSADLRGRQHLGLDALVVVLSVMATVDHLVAARWLMALLTGTASALLALVLLDELAGRGIGRHLLGEDHR